MNEIATIAMRDAESLDEAAIVIRRDRKYVVLSLSLRSDGDVQIVMNINDAKAVVEALRAAVDFAS